ncbi:MAG TPA: hypothetical protein PKU86_03870, partial [Bacteroidales bacterium]|nr:hypothetical protein [Bacteroidales bacterium]
MLKNVDENGNILKEDIGLYTKDEEINPFFEKCRMILQYSTPVSSAKIFNPNKKIFNLTCNPYAIGFTKKIINKNLESIGNDGILEELTQQYFKKAEEFVEEGKAKIWFEGFKSYLKENFWNLLEKIDYASLKNDYSIIFFLKSLTIEDFKIPYQKYLMQNVFNKADYNIIYQDITYGVSESLSTFNDKKRFLKHQSASFKYNYRLHYEDALLAWKFYRLIQNKQLPNPLPIFVDKKEANLNADVVKLFNQDGIVGYSEIISSLLNIKGTDLQNFYLLFIHKGRIVDLDFVPVFKYTLKDKDGNDFIVKELFGAEPVIFFNSKEHNV